MAMLPTCQHHRLQHAQVAHAFSGAVRRLPVTKPSQGQTRFLASRSVRQEAAKTQKRSQKLAATAAEASITTADTAAKTPAQPSTESQLSDSVVVSEEHLPNSHVRLTVTAPPDLVRKSYERAMKKVREDTDVPGFRKGKKVPLGVLIQAAGGQAVINGACVEDMLKRLLPVALEKFKATAIAESERIEEDINTLSKGLDVEGSFTFHVSLDVQPSHSWNASYKDIKVEVPSLGGLEEDAHEVEAKLQQLRKNKGKLRVVIGRPLQLGDMAIVDFKAVRKDSGEVIMGSERKAMQLDTGLGDRAIGLSGVVDGLVGMSVGEERSIVSTVEDTWWEEKNLKGVDIRADISLVELFDWDLPELTDEFVDTAMPGIGGVEGLRRQLMQATAASREREQKERVHEALIKAVAERIDAAIPDSAIRQLAENEYQAKLHEIQLKEQMSFDGVNQLATEELLNQYIESRRQDLVALQKSTLGIQDIFQQEGLQVTDEEIENERSSAVMDFERNNQEFDKDRLNEQVVEVLKAQKVLQWLEDNVSVTIR